MSTSSTILDRIISAAESLSQLNQYPFSNRKDQWRERLQVNLPELEAIDQMVEPECDRYQVTPAYLHAPQEPASDDSSGIAGIALAAAREPSLIGAAAFQSLAEAKRQPQLNAFIELADQAGLAGQAELARGALQPGAQLPLLGVPVAIKDLMAVRGFRLTGGTEIQTSAPATSDALLVKRLRDAGALIVGTTNLHELAYGITSNNPHYGRVINPLAPGFIPGGSSGGSAVAVAAGIVRASVGTDTAGSIRIPAACCGVVGFKPTFDAVSRQGVMNLGPSLDHVGPITRSVHDAALMFSIMAGLPARQAAALRGLKGVRVGVPSQYFFEPLSADVARATRVALKRMQADGAELVAVDLPGMERSAALQFVTLCSEATEIHWRRLIDWPESLGDDVRVRLEVGQLFPAIWYTRAQRARAGLAAVLKQALARVDVLATPTLRVTATPNDARQVTIDSVPTVLHSAMTSLTLPFNLTGTPALSLPCGCDANGLSIGLQLVAARNHDWKLLDISARVETLLAAPTPG